MGSAAAGDADKSSWKFVRKIVFPPEMPEGRVAVPLQSVVIEKCRRDLADLSVAAGENPAPCSIRDAAPDVEPPTFPAKVFKVVNKPGKWTEVWIDKSAKVVTSAVVIETSSRDFMRKVEIRGSDNVKESYVVRMDGLIVDRQGPQALRCLKMDHPLNNFQYLCLRILDEGSPPLKIDAALCCGSAAQSPYHGPLDLRVVEDRKNQAASSSTMVVDLGEKRYPVSSLAISSQQPNFAVKATVRVGSSLAPDAWEKVYEGVFFRVSRDGAAAQNLKAVFRPQPARYVALDLSGSGGPPPAVEKLEAEGSTPLVVFDYQRGKDYSLLYGNPRAEPARPVFSAKPLDAIAASPGVYLSDEEKNAAPPRKIAAQSAQTVPMKQDLGRPTRMIMLLSFLMLVCSVALVYRWVRKPRRRRPSRIYDV
jgi:hypothetical protein